MFSNVDVSTWVFIPFAWGVKIMQSMIRTPMSTGIFFEKMGPEFSVMAALSTVLLLLSLRWFQRWEGSSGL